MRKFVDESEKTSPLRLLSGVDHDHWMARVRETKTATILFRKAVVEDKNPGVFNLLSADKIERVCVLCVELILKRNAQ